MFLSVATFKRFMLNLLMNLKKVFFFDRIGMGLYIRNVKF